MSRKDYVALANAFHEAIQDAESEQIVWGVETALANVADVLQADNPNFNRERFIAAALGR